MYELGIKCMKLQKIIDLLNCKIFPVYNRLKDEVRLLLEHIL